MTKSGKLNPGRSTGSSWSKARRAFRTAVCLMGRGCVQLLRGGSSEMQNGRAIVGAVCASLDGAYRALDRSAGKLSLRPGESVLAQIKGVLGISVTNLITRIIFRIKRIVMTLLGSRIVCHLYVTNERLLFNALGHTLFGIWGRARREHPIPLGSVAYFGWSSDTRFFHLLRTLNIEVHTNSGIAVEMHVNSTNEEELRSLASLMNSLLVNGRG